MKPRQRRTRNGRLLVWYVAPHSQQAAQPVIVRKVANTISKTAEGPATAAPQYARFVATRLQIHSANMQPVIVGNRAKRRPGSEDSERKI